MHRGQRSNNSPVEDLLIVVIDAVRVVDHAQDLVNVLLRQRIDILI